MYSLLNPRVVLPVHGDKKQIREHKRFALSCNIEEVFSAQNGDVCLYNNGKIEKIEEIPTDILGIDRKHCVSLNSELIKNRRRIMYNCSVFISAVIDKSHKLTSFKISSIDILEEDKWKLLEEELITDITPLIEQHLENYQSKTSTEDFIRGQVRRRILKRTDIKPVAFTHIHWQDDETI